MTPESYAASGRVAEGCDLKDGTLVESMQQINPCKLAYVRNWRISHWSVLTLVTMFLVMILIVILPQVDLLDTAFHNGTAPILIHSQANARPIFQTASILFILSLVPMGLVSSGSHHCTSKARSRSAQILNNSFRC